MGRPLNDHMNWRIARHKAGGTVHTTQTVMTDIPLALVEALEMFADRVESIESRLSQFENVGESVREFSETATTASAKVLDIMRIISELEPRLAVLEVRWNAYETALRKEAANAA